MKKLLLLLFLTSLTSLAFSQGSTTAGLNGSVVSASTGETLIGATVIAVHVPTGSEYGATTNTEGFYRIPNLQVGGPYTLTASFLGFQEVKLEGIYVKLGQNLRQDFKMSEEDQTLEEVIVSGQAEGIIDGDRTGAKTTVNVEQINNLPTVARDLSDFTRVTPQARITSNGGITIAGSNNRYNSIFIDGAVNNDVFGLAENGNNGGQSGISPISVDAIEQIEVVVAPYDVRQGGFAGGGINAVTRSGKNKFDGSIYYLFRDENITGKTPTDDNDIRRVKADPFSAKTYGARLGGPIIKNKLFFFVNAEIQRDETPQPFNVNDYQGNTDADGLSELISFVDERYGYSMGAYDNNTISLDGEKFLGKIDWNINQNHKLSIRHSYTKGDNTSPTRSSNTNIYFTNAGISFISTTNSSAIQLKSTFSSDVSNDLILGYTRVRDDRDPLGANFPSVIINDGSGRINFGSEAFSAANALEQDIFTITNNLTLFKGRHTFTFGTHNEFYKVYNLFIRQNFGEYTFNNVSDFINEEVPNNYARSYSLVDNVTGDGSAAAADFNAFQLGFYAQDEYQVLDNLKFTLGVRVDIPIFNDDPTVDTTFNNQTRPDVELFYDLEGARSGKMFDPQLLFAPRIGFNWDVHGDERLQIRGGFGIFNSRVPLVWPAGSYTNNGITIGGVTANDQDFINNGLNFEPDPNNQYTAVDFGKEDPIPSGQMDLFVDDFKLPQVLRTSIGVDHVLPWDLVFSGEFLYTKKLNDVVYYNVNTKPATQRLDGPQDGDRRPVYDRRDPVDSRYTRIILADNTQKGYSYNVTASLQKSFKKTGFDVSVAYTYGRSKAVNDGTSSQNSSQWRFMENVNGKNRLDLTYSDFDLGHRVVGFVSYSKEYLQHFGTSIALFLTAQSGTRFSYIYGGGSTFTEDGTPISGSGQIANDDTGSGSTQADLIFVPDRADQIRLVDQFAADGTLIKSAEQQWEELDAYIRGDEYLRDRRGQYAERNGDRLPFQTVLDLRLKQHFFIETGDYKHTLEVTFDIFNFTNMLNKDWGRQYFVQNENFGLISHVGYEQLEGGGNDITKPVYNFNAPSDGKVESIDDSGVNSSRWQAQIGLRYSF
ncbi:TonB-dependent receptor [Limibacter armeniacum]|uniref:TonB-dependent receptor n=1 Tax=Limibacter armeniacum TaxID=466084 RepID=UPI002FE523DE